jgi:nucleotide-binding universal stress UspA family protein
MTYASLLVHLQSGKSNFALLSAAGQMAERFDSYIIGIAMCQPMVMVSGDGMICGDVLADDQRQITRDLDKAQAEFRNTLREHGTRLEWRSGITIEPPASYLAEHARGADLIVTGSIPADTFGRSRAANSGSIVMEAGKPVFIVPPDAKRMGFDHALVAWKDTRECRRAAADALPLLKRIEHVTVLEIAAIDELDAAHARIQDVVTWLERHGVVAKIRIEPSSGGDVERLHAIADEENADVIVAGAYGHSRLREWVVGGVTRDLLLECKRSVLVSH